MTRTPFHLAQEGFFQDTAANAFVGELRRVPPPTIVLHAQGRRDKLLQHGLKVGIAVVQAEDHPTGTHPAQGQTFQPEVILEHPVVAARLRVINGPHTRHIGRLHRQAL